jgi:mannose-6-phosphate isomerase-like protein (cupin superfamily)
MTDVTVAAIDEMEAINDGITRKARATLGVSAWGMQVQTLPPGFDGYPEHTHEEAGEEEVYIPLEGSGTLVTGDESYDLKPGVMARVGPAQPRKILAGPDGIVLVALGGVVGAHAAASWTELTPPSA